MFPMLTSLSVCSASTTFRWTVYAYPRAVNLVTNPSKASDYDETQFGPFICFVQPTCQLVVFEAIRLWFSFPCRTLVNQQSNSNDIELVFFRFHDGNEHQNYCPCCSS